MRTGQDFGWARAGVVWIALLALLGVAMVHVAGIDASPAMAQEEAAAPAAAAPPAAEAAPQQKSTLRWFYESLGILYSVAFLGLSFTFVALFVMNVLTARRESIVPVALVEGFEAHLNEKRYQEAYEMAKNDESFLGQVLSAGLAKLSAGYEQAIEAMQEVGEEENMKLEHRLSYIALIGTISPMVGLLGTVVGVMITFAIIAKSGEVNVNSIAPGIASALLATVVGLIVAIPALFIYSYLNGRIKNVVSTMQVFIDEFVAKMAEFYRPKNETEPNGH